MFTALNAWTFSPEMPLDEQFAATASAGFAAIELVLSDDGPLRPETPLHECSALAQNAADRGLQIAGLTTVDFWRINYASPDEADRRQAVELTLRMLDRAAALGAGAILVVPAVVGGASDTRMRVAYADALQRTLDALSTLRHEAEARGVTIALENVWNRFLLSPVEAADLIDRVNSPFVGFYLDVGNVLAFGYPQDWVTTLAGRIARVHIKDYDLSRPGSAGFCPLGEGSVDWLAVVGALRSVGYTGPLIYEGDGEPTDICRRLDNILAGRPVLAERNIP
jgi:L-ribulose-5-phosphate 3-epimerase